uniref:CSON006528 protein n=1 Tax=Culicoides sonorensis TaxID=179676 RepID=A0A336KDK1_CULSO
MNPDPNFDINEFIQRSMKAGGEDAQADFGSGGGLPSMEQFFEMLDNVKDMSDAEKEEMKKDLIMRAVRAAQMRGGEGEMGKFVAGPREYLIFTIMIFLIVAVFDTIKLLQDLLQSVNGREIARTLLKKFKILSQSFQELSESERKIVHENLSNDFRSQLKALHTNLVSSSSESNTSVIDNENPNVTLFWTILSFCTVILTISMIIFRLQIVQIFGGKGTKKSSEEAIKGTEEEKVTQINRKLDLNLK